MAQRKSNGDVTAAVKEGERIQAAIDQKDRKQSKARRPSRCTALGNTRMSFLRSTSRSPAWKPT